MNTLVTQSLISLQIQPLLTPYPLHSPPPQTLTPSLKPSPIPFSLKSHQTHHPNPTTITTTEDNGIPADLVKTLAKFKSRHNYIRVLQVSRAAEHPFAGARLLLLDGPGNIHSISFLFKPLTSTYFDVFATLPPLLPPGPLAILGFGAGSAARSILHFYPNGVLHGWELDPAVISVGREFFGLSRLEKEYPDRLCIYIGNALNAEIEGGFSGFLVDLFSKGCLVPELQDPRTWEKMRRRLRSGGRIMVNVGGSCVEAEDSRRDGRVLMEQTLKALSEVFPGEVYVLSLGNGKDDSSIAFCGEFPDVAKWKMALPKPLRFYADMWKSFNG